MSCLSGTSNAASLDRIRDSVGGVVNAHWVDFMPAFGNVVKIVVEHESPGCVVFALRLSMETAIRQKNEEDDSSDFSHDLIERNSGMPLEAIPGK